MLRFFQKYYPIRNIFFIVGEVLFIYFSVILATFLLTDYDSYGWSIVVSRKAFLITFVCFFCLYLNDLYDLKATDSLWELGLRICESLGAAAVILAVIYLVFQNLIIARGLFLVSALVAMVLIAIWRVIYRIVLNRGILDQKIILLGSSNLTGDIIREIKQKPDCGYRVAAVIPEGCNGDAHYADTPVIPWVRGNGNLPRIANELHARKIVVAIKEKRGAFPLKELLQCRVQGINVLEGNSFFEMLTGKLIVGQINPGWLIFSGGFRKSRTRRLLKRSGDLVLSFVLLILCLPLILLVAALVKIDSKGPVLFVQERIGERRKPFRLYKFRTMVDNAEAQTGPVWASDKDERVTRVGRIIRKTRIDELPQLWNVLKGDMSFVGPRPEREFFVRKLEESIPYYAERFSVKPGITGWAQISCGYGSSVDDAIEKLNHELFYIKNISLFMDMMIVLKTVKIVLLGKGAR